MKRTLITIALTTVVVLILVGIVSSSLFTPIGSTFTPVSRSLDVGYGGAGGAVEPYAQAPAAQPPVAMEISALDSSGLKDATVSNSFQTAPQERKVIKNDQLTLVVKDPAKSMKDIVALAEKLGGYVVTSNLYQTTYGPNNISVPQAQVVIRVPAEKLTEATDQIKKGAVEVRSENLTGQDVTDQYVDLQSRLAADQAAADQLLKIMQDAKRTEDVLNVFQQLRQIQSDIEVLKGQIKYIDQSTATSEINVTLIAEEGAQPIEIGGWRLQGTSNQAVQDLINFTQNLTRFLIRVALFNLPALLLIAIPLYLVFLGGRAIFRRFRKQQAKKVEVQKEADQPEDKK